MGDSLVTIEIHSGSVSISSPDREVWAAIKRLEEQQMSTQDEINTITTEVQTVATDLQAASSTLQTEIDNLANQNPAVDLSGLRTAVQPLDAAVQALGALQPLKAEPAPAPAPETPPAEAPATPEQPPVAEVPPTV